VTADLSNLARGASSARNVSQRQTSWAWGGHPPSVRACSVLMPAPTAILSGVGSPRRSLTATRRGPVPVMSKLGRARESPASYGRGKGAG